MDIFLNTFKKEKSLSFGGSIIKTLGNRGVAWCKTRKYEVRFYRIQILI